MKANKRYLVTALTTALFLTLWSQLPHLLDPLAVEEDFRNLYWVHQYRNTGLFPHAQIDHLDQAAPGYATLFRLTSTFVSPILFSKLLAFPLMLVAVYYVYRIVERMGGQRTALVAAIGFAVFNLIAGTELSVTTGLQRAFAVPMLVAFAYYLTRQRYTVAAIVVFISGTLYAPVILAMTVAYVLSCVHLGEKEWWRFTADWRPLAYLAVALTAVVILLWPAFARQADRALPATGDAAESVHILQDPNYTSGGRRALFIYFPFVGRGGIVSGKATAIYLGILGLLALIVRFVRRRPAHPLPFAFLHLLAGSFISFALAWVAIIVMSSFLFYIPSRHTRTVLFLSLLIYVFANVGETLRTAALWLRRHRRKLAVGVVPVVVIVLSIVLFLPTLQGEEYQNDALLPVGRWLLLGLVVILAGLALYLAKRPRTDTLAREDVEVNGSNSLGRVVLASGSLLFALFFIQFMNPAMHTPTEDEQALYSYLETLPKDALLAGDPCSLDGVPLYAKRSILFNCERYDRPDAMIRDALSAYYAADWDEIYAFCREYGVSHLVINAESYTNDVVQNREYFFEPYTSQVDEIIRSRPRYLLAQVSADKRLFDVGRFQVVSCQPKEG